MGTPTTPVTPITGLLSPFSSTSTLVNGFGSTNPEKQPNGHVVEVSPSVVLQKLQEVLSPDEFDESVGKAPNIVVIGRESVGKSSVAPTSISSTHTPALAFRASVHIETTSADGLTRQKHRFTTTPIMSMSELLSVMHRAGNEARHLEVEPLCRTDPAVKHLSQADWASELKHAPEYTMNTVVLHVSGPQQDNLHLTDLPGLGKAPASNVVTNMIAYHAGKTQNIIIHCMAACGGSPTIDECVRLNMAADPTGERTMIVLTQPDNIQDPSDDPWVDLITGDLDPFEGWKPQLGIHPLRLAGPRERKAGMLVPQLRQLESSMFASPEWMEVAKSKPGITFGVPATRSRLLALHEDRVAEWLQSIPSVIKAQHSVIQSAVADLPSLPEDHVAALHTDTIRAISRTLTEQMTGRGRAHATLVSLQKKLMRDLYTVIPLVLPLFKKDESLQGELRDTRGDAMTDFAGERTRVYLDAVLDQREEYRNPRTGHLDDSPILLHYLLDAVKQWEGIVENHVASVAEAVSEAVLQNANERQTMKSLIRTALDRAQEDSFAKTRAHISQMLDDARSDPATTAIACKFDSNALNNGQQYTKLNYERLYTSVSGGQARAQVPDNLKSEDIQATLHLQAQIDTHLILTAFTSGTSIGRRVQRGVLDFLEAVEPALRQAFELEKVEEGVKKRTRGLFESKAQRSKRAKLLAKSKSLSEIEALVASMT